jgi:hypothetical protein
MPADGATGENRTRAAGMGTQPSATDLRSHMVGAERFELSTNGLRGRCARPLRHAPEDLPPAGVEPAPLRLKGGCSPLSYGGMTGERAAPRTRANERWHAATAVRSPTCCHCYSVVKELTACSCGKPVGHICRGQAGTRTQLSEWRRLYRPSRYPYRQRPRAPWSGQRDSNPRPRHGRARSFRWTMAAHTWSLRSALNRQPPVYETGAAAN